MSSNLPEDVLNLLKEANSPIDAFTGLVTTMHTHRFNEPIFYRSLVKIALDLLGEDFILDTYLSKASEQDISNAQYCWHKKASDKLTRSEMLEFILMEDFPEFLKKASFEVSTVLDDIQAILKTASIKELALNSQAKMGDQVALGPEVLKKQRGEKSKVLDKQAMPGPAAKPATTPSLGSGMSNMGSSTSMRAASGASMPALGGMRSGMMRPLGGTMRRGY